MYELCFHSFDPGSRLHTYFNPLSNKKWLPLTTPTNVIFVPVRLMNLISCAAISQELIDLDLQLYNSRVMLLLIQNLQLNKSWIYLLGLHQNIFLYMIMKHQFRGMSSISRNTLLMKQFQYLIGSPYFILHGNNFHTHIERECPLNMSTRIY